MKLLRSLNDCLCSLHKGHFLELIFFTSSSGISPAFIFLLSCSLYAFLSQNFFWSYKTEIQIKLKVDVKGLTSRWVFWHMSQNDTFLTGSFLVGPLFGFFLGTILEVRPSLSEEMSSSSFFSPDPTSWILADSKSEESESRTLPFPFLEGFVSMKSESSESSWDFKNLLI